MPKSGYALDLSAAVLLRPILSLPRYARCPHVASGLVQDRRDDLSVRRDDLSVRIAIKVDLRIDDLVKEPVLGAREDRQGALSRELCFEMIAPERHIEHGAGIELIFAYVIAGC